MDDPNLLALIERINSASLFPDRWELCLAEIARYFGDAAAGFYVFNSAEQRMESFVTTGLEPSFLQSFNNYYSTVNPYPNLVHEYVATGVPISDADLVARDEVRKSEFYSDWIRPQGRDVYQVGCKLMEHNNRSAVLVLHPDKTAFDSMEAQYRQAIGALVPHLTNAIRINRFINDQERNGKSFETIMHRMDLAALILDRQLQIQFANTEAERLLSLGHVLTITPFGTLAAVDHGSAARLEAAFHACTGKRQPPTAYPVRLNSRKDGAAYAAWVQPARKQQMAPLDFGCDPFAALDDEPGILLLIAANPSGREISADVVQEFFELTPAEAKLTAGLANGDNLSTYALKYEVSRNTARAQLSSVFQKTGTSRQAELVALIWRTIGLLGRSQDL